MVFIDVSFPYNERSPSALIVQNESAEPLI